MKYKMICCEVFEREVAFCIKYTDVPIDVEYTKKSAHEKPEQLRKEIQKAIDGSKGYDAILLGFGLCGNSINGLKAQNIKLVVPRAHDCCTIFLGSREKFNKLFTGRESMPWGCTGYCEKDGDYLRTTDTGKIIGFDKTYDEFVEKYGEENAMHIWKTLYPKTKNNQVVFIKIPETYNHTVFKKFERNMNLQGNEIVMEKGSLFIVSKMLKGLWDDDFIVVYPGNEISAIYDREKIIEAKDLKKMT